MTKRKHLSNRYSYLIALTVFLFFLVICFLFFYHTVWRATEHYTEESLHDSVSHQAYQFNFVLGGHFATLNSIAAYLVQSEELLGEDSMALLDALEGGDFQRVMIITADGVGHCSDGTVTYVGDRIYFQQSLAGESVLSDPLESSLDGRERVVLSVPIWLDDGTVGGVLGASFDVTSLSDILFREIYSGSGLPFLVSGNGTLIVTASEQIAATIDELMGEVTFLDQGGEATLKQDFSAHSGGTSLVELDEVELYWAYEPLGQGDWMVCYLVPRDAARESYNFIQRYMLFLSIAFLIGLALLLLAVLFINLRDRKELLRRANTDPLTSLLNKESTQESIEVWLDEGEKVGIQALLMLDMDGFKQINDRYGHAVGDDALQQAAALLGRIFRANDILGRVGGDEYMILMKNVRDPGAVERQMARVCTSMRELKCEAAELVLQCSIGAAYFPEHGHSFDILYRRADRALYRAKNQGKGMWAIFDPALDKEY